MLQDPASLAFAGLCAWVALIVSIWQILLHLRNYTEPVFQRYIVRIIFMVPAYAISSWLSLVCRHGAIWFDTIRDCYEAWVIYNFMSLLMAYLGGPGAVVIKAEGKIVTPSWKHTTCCCPPRPVDGFFLRRCKQGTLQFVLMKPILAVVTLVLYACNKYEEGAYSPSSGYLYLVLIYNVCYTLALYALLLFYLGTEDILQPFKPLLKFVLIKSVIFLTFWQGIGVSMVSSWGEISSPEDGKAVQNFMICVEMAGAAFMMLFAFPHAEYNIGGSAVGMRVGAISHAISIRDVVGDVVHQFAPSYHDYVLYSDGGPAENVKRKKFRGGDKEHPKASLISNMEAGALTTIPEDHGEGGGQKSPPRKVRKAHEKHREKERNMAVLLDSDSDAMDSDEEDHHQLSTMLMSSDDEEGEEQKQLQQEPRLTGSVTPTSTEMAARTRISQS